MPRFEDTPKWKRRQKWDPVKQKMTVPDRAPTKKQVMFLRDLHRKRSSGPFVAPRTRREAQSRIAKLRNRH